MINVDIPAILARLITVQEPVTWQPFGSSHIHDTLLIHFSAGVQPDLILHRFNHLIFKGISGLMRNIVLVTNHIREKLRCQPGANPDRQVLTLIPAQNGSLFYQDEEGSYWRLYRYIEKTNSYDQIQTPQ